MGEICQLFQFQYNEKWGRGGKGKEDRWGEEVEGWKRLTRYGFPNGQKYLVIMIINHY